MIQVYTYPSGVIEFRCISYGLLNASVEAGYYSPDDEPDGKNVGWLHGKLTEDGAGYSYSDGTDNRYYTERMCENFYYYTVANQTFCAFGHVNMNSKLSVLAEKEIPS